jgi:long-chain-fatty-acid---luciferin-component ligase
MKLAQLVVDAELDLAAAPDALIVTAGGWKVAERDTIDPQEFRDLASASLSMKVSQVRDCYGMVELNTAIFSCTSGRLHVPPWLSVRAHDARGRILAGGREGVLGFVDPSATSYAAFVLSDDVGVIEEACQCGRSGETLRVTRRLSTIEGRGCALRIDGSYLR